MSLHVIAAEHHRAADPATLDQRLFDALPDAPPGPAIEAVVDRGVGTVRVRAVAPTAP